MKGGFNGDTCPICQDPYDQFVPKDSDRAVEIEIDRVCAVLTYGGYAAGAYLHAPGDS